jgi:hypothetical protein
MKKTSLNQKLSLQTETLMNLQTTDLDGVNGGVTPAGPILFTASVRFCAPVGAAILGSAQRSCFTCRCR